MIELSCKQRNREKTRRRCWKQ